MGKSRRNDRAKARVNPIAKPVKPPTDPELAVIREKHILPILADLISPESKKRSGAAVAIANIIEDTRCRKLLLREQIVRILLEQTITDSALESKSAGWGVLRNLALEEEADFCVFLYRQDILTAIEGIAQNIIDSVKSKEQQLIKLPKAQQSLVWTLSGSVIGLISSLAEAQDEILQVISKIPSIINFIFGLLDFECLPEGLFVDALFCLATLTEDNQPMAKQIVDRNSWLKGLLQLRELGGAKAVAACGVLHNIFSAMQWFDHNTPVEGISDAILIPALMQYVETSQRKHGITIQPLQSSPEQILQLALEITASIATSLQEALEHEGHNEKEFEGFDDDAGVQDEGMMEDGKSDIDDGEEHTDGSGEMNEEEIDADMELLARADIGEEDEATVTQPTLDTLIRIATPDILSIAENSSTQDAVRASALSALNNISWTVSSIDSSLNRSSLSKTWAGFAQRIWSEIVCPILASNTADIELASSITSIAWAIARSAQDKLKLEGEEHNKFIALYQASRSLPPVANGHQYGGLGKSVAESSDAFQGLGVKCIGVLGRLALHPTDTALNREIGYFLLTILSTLPETPVAEAVEALNQLFDIYADKEYSYDKVVFWDEGFYQRLEAAAPKARKMAKSIDKRRFTELRLRADEAVLNLGRFLAYKRKEETAS